MQNIQMLDYALQYYRAGLNIVPATLDKRGLYPWERFQDQKVTEHEVRSWWGDKCPNAGIAMVCGPISENVIVIDLDLKGDENGMETIRKMGLALPPTAMANSGGGGRHVFTVVTGGPYRTKVRALPGIDLKCSGLLLLPPSPHPSGNRYEWIPEMEFTSIKDLAPAPQWVLDLLEKEEVRIPAGLQLARREAQWYDDLLDGVKEGQRHDALKRLIGRWFGLKLDVREVKVMALDFGARCKPPMDSQEIDRLVLDIYRMEMWKQAGKDVLNGREIEWSDLGDDERRKLSIQALQEALPGGIEVKGVRVYTGDKYEYRLVTTTGEVTIGDENDFTSQRKFRAALLKLEKINLRPVKDKVWNTIVDHLLELAEYVTPGSEATIEGQTMEWIRNYITKKKPQPVDQLEVKPGCPPFIYNGKTCITNSHFTEYLRLHGEPGMNTLAMAPRLAKINAQPIKGRVNGQLISYWVLPDIEA